MHTATLDFDMVVLKSDDNSEPKREPSDLSKVFVRTPF